jgi:Cellulose synthase operon protein C C-terminus (BCSC_C)
VTGSVGTQSYQQGAIVSGSLLTDVYATPSASANYVLDARGSYRITPNWYLEAFLSANNTYDYQQRTAGFSLKYMTHPHPAGESAMPTGLFDVQSIRPLLIP